MAVILSGICYQQTGIPIFTLTQRYIYYGLITCFGSYLNHHHASPVT